MKTDEKIIRSERTPLSRTARYITVVTLAALIPLGLILPLFLLFDPSVGETERIVLLLSTAIVAVSIVVAALYAPRRVELRERSLRVRRLAGSLILPYGEIKAAEPFDPVRARRLIRTFGSGGLFGYLGQFYDRRDGFYRIYAGDLGQALLIRLRSGRRYVISCERPGEMLAGLRQRIGG